MDALIIPTADANLQELRLSDLAPRALQSEIRAMTMECDRIGGVNLAQGVCDTEPPAPVIEGAIAAIHAGHNIYTRLDGILRLRYAEDPAPSGAGRDGQGSHHAVPDGQPVLARPSHSTGRFIEQLPEIRRQPEYRRTGRSGTTQTDCRKHGFRRCKAAEPSDFAIACGMMTKPMSAL